MHVRNKSIKYTIMRKEEVKMNAREMLELLSGMNRRIAHILTEIQTLEEIIDKSSDSVKQMVMTEQITELKNEYKFVAKLKKESIELINEIRDKHYVDCLMFMYAEGRNSIANYVAHNHITYNWGWKIHQRAVKALDEVLKYHSKS